MELHVGLDVGSTTAKLVVLDEKKRILFKEYQRHFSDIKNTTLDLLRQVARKFPGAELKLNSSGSSAIGLSEHLGIPFIQEVVACTEAVKTSVPHVDVIIELGGEDAKLVYLTNGLEQRMNSSCAGGTGAFIDQIAALLDTDAAGLNELARKAEKIYPIASRCGVFAKMDIQPLLNEGARKEDIAASTFQAVVNQTIGGLACGRPIRGNVAFLGGPLTFLDQLRIRFIKTLKMTEEQVVFSENGHFYVALGAALESVHNDVIDLGKIISLLQQTNQESIKVKTKTMAPLFRNEKELEEFRERHAHARVPKGDLATYSGPAFLGIDAGSTTTKIILTGTEDEVLYTFYEQNKGNPLESVKKGLLELYDRLPGDILIANSCVTGYGEKLIQAAYLVDEGEIETVAHYRAAKKFQPDVDFILDIGGQDMKCIKIKNGVIDQIMLNEACSSGCGSFLETFAESLGFPIEEFARLALKADAPPELGSRCTVFMNSRVKQVQKEGASIQNISAGLAYSVVLNALYKVIKLQSPDELGAKIVVQGGTFLNDAVLRAFEITTGKNVIRPDLAGLMGAYGCALLARERWDGKSRSTLLPVEKIRDFEVKTRFYRCGICENNCPITMIIFPNRRRFISGNRCERGAGKPQKEKSPYPNLLEEKMEKLFSREGLTGEQAPRGKIGIPRVLNMYENYPFWHRFFTELGFEVVISAKSSKQTFEDALETIPSEAVCYPAKLVHGHIINLLKQGVKKIFYPAVVYEQKEDAAQQNHFNCPIVSSYPEVIRINMGPVLEKYQAELIAPFLTLDNPTALARGLFTAFPDIPKKEIKQAMMAARFEQEEYKQWLQRRGEEVIHKLEASNQVGIVIGAHPYHVDPAIHHGIPEEINRLGMAVLTEDAICHLAKGETSVPVVNQWTYHSRLYRAAEVVAAHPNLEFLQLVSFGCGLDAITTDACKEILESHNRLYTWIKLDEISNIGAARIRLRSLQAAIKERRREHFELKKNRIIPTPVFTKDMRKTYTILAPQMAPTHFKLIQPAARAVGYEIVVMEEVTEEDVNTGLQYVNNDACYPAIITIGQLVHALKSGKYDVDRTAVVISQTGGGCRATNYYALLKKAVRNAGFPQVPVLSINPVGKAAKKAQPGFTLANVSLLKRLVAAVCLGDLLDRVTLATRPYEKIPGSTNRLFQQYMDKGIALMKDFSLIRYKELILEIVKVFSRLEINPEKKPKVGIVGEILVKYHPYANNQIIDVIEEEGGEAVVTDLLDFFLYSLFNQQIKADYFGKSQLKAILGKAAIEILEMFRNPVRNALIASGRFAPPLTIDEIAEKATRFVGLGNQMGEGWLLPGEIGELMDRGVKNIVCLQPFGCLPNHIIGRGTFNAVKKVYPEANLVAIDYDASISKVNQLNRIKLMLNVAKEKLQAIDKQLV